MQCVYDLNAPNDALTSCLYSTWQEKTDDSRNSHYRRNL